MPPAWSYAGAGARQFVGASRGSVADGVDDSLDGVLEAVAVRRDDPCVRGCSERRHRAGRWEGVAPAQRLEDRLRIGTVWVEPALFGSTAGTLLCRGVEEDLEVGVGQDDRPDVAAGHHDPTRRSEVALALQEGRP